MNLKNYEFRLWQYPFNNLSICLVPGAYIMNFTELTVKFELAGRKIRRTI